MEVKFARSLEGIVTTAMRDSRVELRFGLGMIADIILENLEATDAPVVSEPGARPRASEALAIASSAVEVMDACQFIACNVLSVAARYCCKEFELPRNPDHDVVIDLFRRHIASTDAPVSFVFVVWVPEPERYLYVGSGEQRRVETRRIELDTSEALLPALTQGSLITLMLPSSTGASAVDLEAALLSVLHSQKALSDVGAMSRQRSRVPGMVREIGRLLGEPRASREASIGAIASRGSRR
jgi:hypothetical protein